MSKFAEYMKGCYEGISEKDVILQAQFLSAVLEQPAKYRVYSASSDEALINLYRETVQELEPLFYKYICNENISKIRL
jgi:hypothetical protein